MRPTHDILSMSLLQLSPTSTVKASFTEVCDSLSFSVGGWPLTFIGYE